MRRGEEMSPEFPGSAGDYRGELERSSRRREVGEGTKEIRSGRARDGSIGDYDLGICESVPRDVVYRVYIYTHTRCHLHCT